MIHYLSNMLNQLILITQSIDENIPRCWIVLNVNYGYVVS